MKIQLVHSNFSMQKPVLLGQLPSKQQISKSIAAEADTLLSLTVDAVDLWQVRKVLQRVGRNVLALIETHRDQVTLQIETRRADINNLMSMIIAALPAAEFGLIRRKPTGKIEG